VDILYHFLGILSRVERTILAKLSVKVEKAEKAERAEKAMGRGG